MKKNFGLFLSIGAGLMLAIGAGFYYHQAFPDILADEPVAGNTRAITTAKSTCGLDVALVVDNSGSISYSEMQQQKSALKAFVDSFLPATPTLFSLTEMHGEALVVQAFTSNKDLLKSKIDSIKFMPMSAADMTGHDETEYYTYPHPTQYFSGTNWEDGLIKARSTFDPRANKDNMIIFATDGSPTVYNYGDLQLSNDTIALNNAITQASSIKTTGTKILGIAIGNSAELNINNIKSITGQNVSPDPVPIGMNSDVITSDFSTMSTDLANLFLGMCSRKILIQSKYDTNNDGVAELDGSVSNPLLAGDLLTVDGSIDSITEQTKDDGYLQFDLSTDETYRLNISPSSDKRLVSASCTKNTSPIGTFNAESSSISGLSIAGGEVISCEIINKANPSISVAVTATPASLPIGGGQVAFSYTLTGVNSQFLTNLKVTDSQCAPVDYMSGDTNNDGIMQPTENWHYTCSTFVRESVTNQVLATGTYGTEPYSANASINNTVPLAPKTVIITPTAPPRTGR